MATQEGFEISWVLPEHDGAFFVEPGQIPADVIRNARFWRSRMVNGAVAWEAGNVDLESLQVVVAREFRDWVPDWMQDPVTVQSEPDKTVTGASSDLTGVEEQFLRFIVANPGIAAISPADTWFDSRKV